MPWWKSNKLDSADWQHRDRAVREVESNRDVDGLVSAYRTATTTFVGKRHLLSPRFVIREPPLLSSKCFPGRREVSGEPQRSKL